MVASTIARNHVSAAGGGKAGKAGPFLADADRSPIRYDAAPDKLLYSGATSIFLANAAGQAGLVGVTPAGSSTTAGADLGFGGLDAGTLAVIDGTSFAAAIPTIAVGMGIDAGPLLLGRIGYGESVDFTVIGNPVNVASRLESLTKERDVQLIMSRAVARMAGYVPPAAFSDKIGVRGVAEPVQVIMVKRGRDLPADVLALRDDEKEREKPAAWTAGFWGRR